MSWAERTTRPATPPLFGCSRSYDPFPSLTEQARWSRHEKDEEDHEYREVLPVRPDIPGDDLLTDADREATDDRAKLAADSRDRQHDESVDRERRRERYHGCGRRADKRGHDEPDGARRHERDKREPPGIYAEHQCRFFVL